MKKLNILFLIVIISFLFNCKVKQNTVISLVAGFENPPESVKPRTWFHAMSGNMTKEGLTKDLEAMAQVGIGGLLLFNVTQGIPNGPIIYNSEEHHKLITHTATEAERLGLSFGVHNCDGWSASGGPWVTPEESMKMVVWSEIVANGGTIDLQLPVPTKREGLYKDIAVIAYPSLNSEIDDFKNQPIITASDEKLDIKIISDGKIEDESTLEKKENQEAWIQFSYPSSKTIQSSKITFNDRHTAVILQTSKDGKTFEDVKKLFKVRTGKGEWAVDDHFEPINSNFFRLKFNQTTTIKEAQLTANYFINNSLGRTAIARTENHQLDPIGVPKPEMIINKSSIKNLTGNMDEKGNLKTELPEGKWSILRFGYTSTGAFNNPASDAGRGLEVDKLNRKAFKNFFDGFVQKVIDNTKPVAPNALQYIEIDSYEMGGQNWTNDFDTIFNSENEYSFINFLPLVAGRFVDSPEISETVLSDFRKVISNLMTENYFAYFTELCNENGLKSYIEPYGFGPLNDLDIGGKTDIPMGEFWMNRPITQTASAVSSAHIYGKPVISAESFTSNPTINWKGHPAMAKASGDLAWTYGINEFMFHRFVHQSNPNVEPGMTMNRWGFHFDRTQTWWKNSGADWFKYIARGSYMLRQGNPVSDLLIYVGEGSPNSSYYRTDFDPMIPKTINFDNVNTDVLINRIEIRGNSLVLPEGTEYKILLLKNIKVISLKTLKRILEIANSGIPVMGDIPEKLSGYNQSEASIKQFSLLKSQLSSIMEDSNDWDAVLRNNRIIPDLLITNYEAIDYAHRKTNDEDIYFFFNEDTLKTKTFNASFRVSHKIPELWNAMTGKITKQGQFQSKNGTTTTNITLNAGESVFVVFREDAKETVSALNTIENVDLSLTNNNGLKAAIKQNGDYAIPLSSGKTWEFLVTDIPRPTEISKDWEVTFQKEKGYGGTVKFDSLVDWSEHPLQVINFYSGTATYKKEFLLTEKETAQNNEIILNLGNVFIVAEVKINGQPAGVSWIPPFKLNITDFVETGFNTLEISVTNQWSNRLIGDERYPANDGGYKLGPHRATDLTMPDWYTNNEPRPSGQRTTFTTAPFYTKNDPLMPSGLLGPVRLKFIRINKKE